MAHRPSPGRLGLSLTVLALPLLAAAPPRSHVDATVAQLQAELAAGQVTSEDLTREYLARVLRYRLAYLREGRVVASR